jgi:hypothetical protein
MGLFLNEVGIGGSNTQHVQTGGHQRHMPVHDSAMADQDGGDGATTTGGGRVAGVGGGQGQGSRHVIIGGVGVIQDVLVLQGIPRGRGERLHAPCMYDLDKTRSGASQVTGNFTT